MNYWLDGCWLNDQCAYVNVFCRFPVNVNVEVTFPEGPHGNNLFFSLLGPVGDAQL